MRFIDLSTQQKQISEVINKNIRAVLKHGKYIMRPEIQELEQKLGAYVGVKHSIGCSSGTDALGFFSFAFRIAASLSAR